MADSEMLLNWGNMTHTLGFKAKIVIPGSKFVFDGKIHFAILIR